MPTNKKQSAVSLDYMGTEVTGDLYFKELQDGSIAYYVQATYIDGSGARVINRTWDINPQDQVTVSAANGVSLTGKIRRHPQSKRPVLVGKDGQVLSELVACDLNS